MIASAQMGTYLSWLRERGLIWPSPRAQADATSVQQESGAVVDDAAFWNLGSDTPRVLFLSDYADQPDSGAIFSEALDPLVQKMWQAMKLKPEDYAVGHLLPNASIEEVSTSIRARIQALAPEIIVCFGARSLALLDETLAATPMGEIIPHKEIANCTVISTHHPRELLKDPQKKLPTWQHLKLVMQQLHLT